jgi:hypothetical protein
MGYVAQITSLTLEHIEQEPVTRVKPRVVANVAVICWASWRLANLVSLLDNHRSSFGPCELLKKQLFWLD